MPGDEQQEGQRDQLVLGEPVAALVDRVHEGTEQVLPEALAAGAGSWRPAKAERNIARLSCRVPASGGELAVDRGSRLAGAGVAARAGGEVGGAREGAVTVARRTAVVLTPMSGIKART
ncbi:hypothetical protein GCM10017674_58130 [Streptomyces gardneri]|uniref:Uncharacterized protein n=1 Tax=Streptomyces gardneri TaxID=66892 RepID=A0A4Y3RNG2_9ACTN|nr:hypothetical protein SGA01_47000 [Streptomyces gardneri]GHH12231.1 hypothetical protein GCM10017674_58130 [Streptomyces gardneri]